MKKQFNLSAAGRKLSLNKKTISNLHSPEMSRLIGGGSCIKGYSCENNHTYNCTQNQHCTHNCTLNQGTCPGHNTCYTC